MTTIIDRTSATANVALSIAPAKLTFAGDFG